MTAHKTVLTFVALLASDVLFAVAGPAPGGATGTSTGGVPELSTNAIISGVTVLIAGALIFFDWKRRKKD